MSKMFWAKASVPHDEMAAPSGDCTGSSQISVFIIESTCTSLYKLEKEIDRIGYYVIQAKDMAVTPYRPKVGEALDMPLHN